MKAGQMHNKKLTLVVILLSQALIFVCEQNDSNTVLPLPEERLEDIWLSLPQHGGGVTATCPPTSPEKNAAHKYIFVVFNMDVTVHAVY